MWTERTTAIIDVICVVMLVVGTIGNLLGLLVFSSRKFRRTRYGRIALISFLINILCVLRYSLLIHSKCRLWISFHVGQSWFNCKVYRLSSCLRILSAFVLVTWTYERFVYVTTPSTSPSALGLQKYKFYVLPLLFGLVIGGLTGPNVYFYHPVFFVDRPSTANGTSASASPVRGQCALKESMSVSWHTFLVDVRFGWNYTTLRSIFSEVIPSVLVLLFDIGIIVHVVQSDWRMSFHSPSTSSRPSFRSSFQTKDFSSPSSSPCPSSASPLDGGLMVHNRPRTSWMNVGLIIHSSLFCFSSLTATIVHWATSNVLLSYWSSVLILGNSSFYFYIYCLTGKSFRQEIQKIFYRYFQLYCLGKCFNLCRNAQEREASEQTIHMRLIRHRSTIIPPQAVAHLRRPSAYFA